MYAPKLYRINDLEQIDSFLLEHSFGVLITSDKSNIPIASHLPFEWELKQNGERALHCHVSRANSLWEYISEQPSALFIVQGAHTYISPRWYAHENVPTWNYMAAHIYGIPQITFDADVLLSMVSRLTKNFEDKSGYSVDHHSPEFLQKQLSGIVGITLHVEKVETTFKISQNRKEEDYTSVIHHLEQSHDQNSLRIAEEMKKIKPEVFRK